MDTMRAWMTELRQSAVKTIEEAKNSANPFENTIWRLRSGAYVSLRDGQPIRGADPVLWRVGPQSEWRPMARRKIRESA